jgi:hypothetical protein
MKFVCPLPPRWGDIYLALQETWEASGRPGDGPPVPLILNGWVVSSDFDKHQRWQDTVEWANQHGLAHLIPELSDSEEYLVAEFSRYAGPVFGEQFEKPKTKPTAEELRQILRHLQESWSEVVGKELANHTYPLRFSGHKKRRLVLRADTKYKSPWGGWNSFGTHGDRPAFTTFRKHINDAIVPHGVDHIVFKEED